MSERPFHNDPNALSSNALFKPSTAPVERTRLAKTNSSTRDVNLSDRLSDRRFSVRAPEASRTLPTDEVALMRAQYDLDTEFRKATAENARAQRARERDARAAHFNNGGFIPTRDREESLSDISPGKTPTDRQAILSTRLELQSSSRLREEGAAGFNRPVDRSRFAATNARRASLEKTLAAYDAGYKKSGISDIEQQSTDVHGYRQTFEEKNRQGTADLLNAPKSAARLASEERARLKEEERQAFLKASASARSERLASDEARRKADVEARRKAILEDDGPSTEIDYRGDDTHYLNEAQALSDWGRFANGVETGFESPEHAASVTRGMGLKYNHPSVVEKANALENAWLNSARTSAESAPTSIPPQERVATPPPLPSFSRPRNPSERSSDIAEMAGRIREVLDQEPSDRRMNSAPEGVPSQNPSVRLRDRATLSPDAAEMAADIERVFDRDTKDKEGQPEKKTEAFKESEKIIVDSGLGREFSAKELLLIKMAEDTRFVNSTTPALRNLQSQLNAIEDGDAAAGKPSFQELYGTTITALQNNTSTLSAWGMMKNAFYRTIGNREKSANAILEKYNAIKAEADIISEQIEAAKKRIAENKTEIAEMESVPTLSDRERAMMRRAGITHLTRGGYERKLTQEEIEAAETGPRREQETRFFKGLRGKYLSSDTQEVLTGMPSLQVRTEAVLNSGIKDTETARSIAEEMSEAEWKRFIEAQEKATVRAAPYTGDPNTRSFGSFYRHADKWNRPTINQEVYSSSTMEGTRTKQKPEAVPTKIKDLMASELPEMDLTPEESALTESPLGPMVPRIIKAYFKNTPEVFRSAIQSAEAFTQLEDPKDGLGSMFWRLNGVDLEDAKKYIEDAAMRESKVPNSLFAEAKRANKLNRLILNIQRLYEGVRKYTQKNPGGPENKYLPPFNQIDKAAA
ncbi:hypothetical protein KBB27_03465 [Patescibacteria group bacterium]|nr:hypothetical protein [Patescibacteria group bacterium]